MRVPHPEREVGDRDHRRPHLLRGVQEGVADEFLDEFCLADARKHIEARFDKDRSLSWRKALEVTLEGVREEHADAFKAAVEKKLRERLDLDGGHDRPSGEDGDEQ
jgi:hypothetical protein